VQKAFCGNPPLEILNTSLVSPASFPHDNEQILEAFEHNDVKPEAPSPMR